MNHMNIDEAFVFLQTVNAPMYQYVTNIDDEASEPLLLEQDVQFSSMRMGTSQDIFDLPGAMPASSQFEYLLSPVVYSDGENIVRSTPDLEIERLCNSLQTSASLGSDSGCVERDEKQEAGRSAQPPRRRRTASAGEADPVFEPRILDPESPIVKPFAQHSVFTDGIPSNAFGDRQDFPGLGVYTAADSLGKRHIVVRDKLLIWGGVMGMLVTHANGVKETMMGRFVADLCSGWLMSILRLQEEDLVVIFTSRSVGLNRKDKWLVVCTSDEYRKALSRDRASIDPSAVLSASHFVEYRRCPVCGAAAEPSACTCERWTDFQTAMLQTSGKHEMLRLQVGGIYTGVVRSMTAFSHGTDVSLVPSLCPAYTDTYVSFEPVQPVISSLIQHRLSAFVQAPMWGHQQPEVGLQVAQYGVQASGRCNCACHEPLVGATCGIEPCCILCRPLGESRMASDKDKSLPDASANSDLNSSPFGFGRVDIPAPADDRPKVPSVGAWGVQAPSSSREVQPTVPLQGTSNPQIGFPAVREVPPVAQGLAQALSAVEAQRLLEEEKERKAHTRKLRNRDAALRSNQKRSQNYKNLIANVEKARAHVQSLREREEELREENKRLRALAKSAGVSFDKAGPP